MCLRLLTLERELMGGEITNAPTSARCPACDASQLTSLERISVADQHRHYSDNPLVQQALTAAMDSAARKYHMCRCNACGLEFADPLIAPSADWYRLAYQAQDLYPSTRWEFGAVLDRVPLRARLLELGCGSGAFLKLCRERDLSAAGVDFATDAIAECQRDGLDARVADVCQSILLPDEAAPDHITAFHVLEHLERPLALFEQAALNASASTTFWIAVPSHRRGSRWRGETDFLDQPPHHMTRWTESALRAIGERAGWVLERVTYEPLEKKDALWTIATSHAAFRWLLRRGMKHQSVLERGVRLALYPWAALKRLRSARNLTGFTMLAQFRRAFASAEPVARLAAEVS
jgi:SAM-dependent methyltransferase